MIRKAIIPAAGLGTRFLPATKAQPKEMLPIVDKPAIQYIVEEAIAAGIEDIMIVTGRNKRAIEDHFDKSIELEFMLEEKGKEDLLKLVRDISKMVDIHYIRQKQPLGLGHAILCARAFIGNEPFAVLLGDNIIESDPPSLKEMIQAYETYRSAIIAVQEVPWEEVTKYGIVSPSAPAEGHPNIAWLSDLIEKPEREHAPSNLAIIGRYVIEPDIFHVLENQRPGRGGEIQLTDALRDLNHTRQMLAYKVQGKRYDVGDKFGYIEATIEFALRRPDLAPSVKQYLKGLVQSWEGE